MTHPTVHTVQLPSSAVAEHIFIGTIVQLLYQLQQGSVIRCTVTGPPFGVINLEKKMDLLQFWGATEVLI